MARKKVLSKEDSFKEIMKKKEFSGLPLEDVKLIYSLFDEDSFGEEEKIKKSRALLKKVYTAFTSKKLLIDKGKEPFWFLKKHMSTKERFPFYEKLYLKILRGFNKKDKILVYDLGSGVNGFSYPFFKKLGFEVKYVGFESIGQLVSLQNKYFKGNGNFKCLHRSLFDLKSVKKEIKKGAGKKIVFLFKVIDGLEMVKRNYSKKLLESLVPLVDLVVLSFATRSLVSRKKFFVKRNWIKKFIEENFSVLGSFEMGEEEYLLFSKKGL